jgi:hypothetical protein
MLESSLFLGGTGSSEPESESGDSLRFPGGTGPSESESESESGHSFISLSGWYRRLHRLCNLLAAFLLCKGDPQGQWNFPEALSRRISCALPGYIL